MLPLPASCNPPPVEAHFIWRLGGGDGQVGFWPNFTPGDPSSKAPMKGLGVVLAVSNILQNVRPVRELYSPNKLAFVSVPDISSDFPTRHN